MPMDYKVRAGQYRDYVTIERRKLTIDDGGGGGDTIGPEAWETVESVWCKVSPSSANEMLTAQQRGLTITHNVEMRYYEGFQSSWRLAFDGRYLYVINVYDVEERQRKMLLQCEERRGKEDNG